VGESGVEILLAVYCSRAPNGNPLDKTTDGGEAAGTSRALFTVAVNDSRLEREMAVTEAFKAITHCGEITGISPVKGTIWGGASDTSWTFLVTDVKSGRSGLGTTGICAE
jgi:hypothetical protein